MSAFSNIEKTYIIKALIRTKGKVKEAHQLNYPTHQRSYTAYCKRIERYNIDINKYKHGHQQKSS